jgi:glutamyl-tRNA synthetase
VDDALMAVTHVLRGEDHLTNTPRQILLLRALDLPIPQYAHIALVVGADGAPLSKRTGSKSVEELRLAGFLPSAINNYLARLGHTYEATQFLDPEALASAFAVERLHRAPAHYDEMHLNHWQHQAVLHVASAELWVWMGPAVHALVPDDKRDAFIDAVRGNLVFPADALRWAQVAFGEKLVPTHAAHQVIVAAGGEFFDAARRALEKDGADFKAVSNTIKHMLSVSGKALFQPLRAALTGELDGPEMAKLLPLMGMERARQRLISAGDNRN